MGSLCELYCVTETNKKLLTSLNFNSTYDYLFLNDISEIFENKMSNPSYSFFKNFSVNLLHLLFSVKHNQIRYNMLYKA